MRRALLLLLAGLTTAVGLIQVAPPPDEGPNFATVDVAEPDGAVSSPSVWYCPWVEAGDIVDTDIMVSTDVDVDVNLTLLDPLTNEAPTVTEFSIVGPGAAGIDTGAILRRGESPALVEISDGPAAAASMAWADSLLSGDRCIVSVPKVWYLTGGTTRTGSFTELRLFNPFADNAEVTIVAYSEFGVDLVADLDGLDVEGRSWTTIDLEKYLPFRDELAFTITSTKGLVIPALIRTDDRGEAMWPGSAPSETWDFPVVTTGGLEPFIAVLSAGEDQILVSVDILTEDGSVRNAREITIDSSIPALIPLSDLAAAPFGVRLRATSPIAASVIAVVPVEEVDGGEGELSDENTTTSTSETATTTIAETEQTFIRGLAGTVGIARPSSGWIVPIDTLPQNETTMWILNAGGDAVTVAVDPLGQVEFSLEQQTFTVGPGSIYGVEIDVGIGIYGYHVTADGPVSVSWEISGERGAALVAGIPDQ
ncbi:MAG: hypothetical protein BMS9Abin20_0099 [Acidimicrobiia bacterium]|nr:MAG: hypothetical protein BMS9Abin20_0099 [Acidimicrobiia bacterium]